MKKRILVVDDESDFTTLLKYSLESDGYYEVEQENDPTRALATAREFDPDLCILDVMMPDLDGSDVAARLREDIRFAHMPIIFMTALVLGTEVPAGMNDRGGQTYLPKSTPIDKLIDCIEEKMTRPVPLAAH
jgi:DNA-binding response OmpR family regulator